MESQVMYMVLMAFVVVGAVIAKRTSSEVRALQRYARARGIALDRPWEFRTVRHGLSVRVQAFIPRGASRAIEVTARVSVPSALRLDYLTHATWTAPVDGTAEAWAPIIAACPQAIAGCNGTTVLVRVPDHVPGDDVLDAMIELAARLARWDDGLSPTLLALPGAALLEEHELNPGVVLAPDDLMIGVRLGAETIAQVAGGGLAAGTATVRDGVIATEGEVPVAVLVHLGEVGTAELLVVGTGARLTWPHVERDPARLRAGVAALRGVLGAVGPDR